jgi:hypothetical protein
VKLIAKYACRVFFPEQEGWCDHRCPTFINEGPCNESKTVEADLDKLNDINKFLFYYIKAAGRQ